LSFNGLDFLQLFFFKLFEKESILNILEQKGLLSSSLSSISIQEMINPLYGAKAMLRWWYRNLNGWGWSEVQLLIMTYG
jgi:hypothetical protein